MNADDLRCLLDDQSIRFICNRKNGTIHDRQCKELENISFAHADFLSFLTPQYARGTRLCRKCRRKAAVRNGMHGDSHIGSKQFLSNLHFFNSVCAGDRELVNLFIYQGGGMELICHNCMEIKLREDRWRIILEGEELILMHNNYTVNADYSRNFSDGFHRQHTTSKNDFSSIAAIIIAYSFDYHKHIMEAYDDKVRLLHLETELALVNNYKRVEKSSLLFENYIFVDMQNLALSQKRNFKLGSLRITEKSCDGDYPLVSCRVLRWKRRKFQQLMEFLKKEALKQRHYEYVPRCEKLIPQIA